MSEFVVDGLDKYLAWLQSLEAKEVDALKSRILRSGGLRVLEYLHDLTPVRSGRLAGSFVMGSPDNFFQLKLGRTTSYVRVGTQVEYAKWVNDGFQQHAGQFVPGTWASGQFHYQPDAYPQGMVLTGKHVPGAHMFEKAMDYMEDDMSTIIGFELRLLWNKLAGG